MMKVKRRVYWILPEFQARMLRHWIVLVCLAVGATHLITLAFVWRQDASGREQYYYVTDAEAAGPLVVNPIAVKHASIALPILVVSLTLGLIATILGGVFYSHRLAGPLYHIRRTLRDALDGKNVSPIVLRKNDEFKELAAELNQLLERLGAVQRGS